MDSARIAQKLRAQILQFSGELTRGLPKVLVRFAAEMIYGIQARQSVRVTEVSRALAEPIRIKKTVERLSRRLKQPELGQRLAHRLLELAADRIRDMSLLIIDLSDVHKKYAKKMEHLATVWDGSEHDKARGYWTVNIVGAETGSAQIVPLYGRLFSHAAPDFESENVELREAIGTVAEKTKKRGIWVMDRGGDRGYLYEYLLEETIRFMKQSYQVQDIRVLTYDRLQNLISMVTAVLYFTAVYLGIKMKLRVLSKHLIRAARRVFGVPEFRLYALADGIRHVLFNRSAGAGTSPRAPASLFSQRRLVFPQ